MYTQQLQKLNQLEKLIKAEVHVYLICTTAGAAWVQDFLVSYPEEARLFHIHEVPEHITLPADVLQYEPVDYIDKLTKRVRIEKED